MGLAFKTHTLAQTKTIIREIGGSLGLGFKFRVAGNQIDLNYYLGKRKFPDTFNTEFVQQLQIGISLADLWFVKRRQK
jgi:hypothetical protein